LLAKIKQEKMFVFVEEFREIISDRKDKQVLSDRAQIHC